MIACLKSSAHGHDLWVPKTSSASCDLGQTYAGRCGDQGSRLLGGSNALWVRTQPCAARPAFGDHHAGGSLVLGGGSYVTARHGTAARHGTGTGGVADEAVQTDAESTDPLAEQWT